MTTIDGLILALVIVSVLGLVLFIWVFEKIGENKRSVEYYAKNMNRTDDRVFKNDLRISKLYKEDDHGFERPKVDLVREDFGKLVDALLIRIEALEKKKEVTK